MGWGVCPEPPQRFLPLALGRDRAPASALVGGHDDVHEALEEVALGRVAGAPGQLECLVRVEEAPLLRELGS